MQLCNVSLNTAKTFYLSPSLKHNLSTFLIYKPRSYKYKTYKSVKRLTEMSKVIYFLLVVVWPVKSYHMQNFFFTGVTFTPSLEQASSDLGLVRTYFPSSNCGSSKFIRSIFGMSPPVSFWVPSIFSGGLNTVDFLALFKLQPEISNLYINYVCINLSVSYIMCCAYFTVLLQWQHWIYCDWIWQKIPTPFYK